MTVVDALDPNACYRAIQTRDARFDGRIFVGVVTTGVYCRPVCPARTPKRENCRFYPTAAAAQEAGFRPCLRCRPETAPDLASWRGTSNTVARALTLIANGALDGDESGVDALAERLGVGGRQLRRLFKEHLGASPIAVAQTRRVLFAKQLIHETKMPMSQIALAAGFGSVRRFNETFRILYHRPPADLRRARSTATSERSQDAGVTLRLRYRPPYDWFAMISFLAARAVEGMEAVSDDVYSRTVAHEGELGTVEVRNEPSVSCLAVTVRFPNVRALPTIVNRVRRVFDVGADIEAIAAHLSRDPHLARLVALRPGLRAPGGWDDFELAIRAVLGQQVTVSAARVLAGRLVGSLGERLPAELARRGLVRAFPSPEGVAASSLAALGMPESRRATLRSVAAAAVADAGLFGPHATLDDAIERLRSVKGIGEWTAHYIALRALREPDAFPASDIGLLRGAAVDGERPTPAALLARAERWRPWRAYAAQHLWAVDLPVVEPGLRAAHA